MALIGVNGGLIGTTRTPSTQNAVGIWTLNELALQRRMNLWPGQPFSVNSLSPYAWFDASNASSITASGGKVSQWSDLSGNNRHASQSNASYQPSYTASAINGLACVDWGSSANPYTLNYSGSVAINEVYMVLQGTFTNNVFPEYFGLISGLNNVWLTADSSGTGFYSIASGATACFGSSTTNRSTNMFPEIKQPCVIRFTYATGWSDSGFALGMDRTYTVLNRAWRGYFAEIVLFNRVLPEADRVSLVDYLTAKWIS